MEEPVMFAKLIQVIGVFRWQAVSTYEMLNGKRWAGLMVWLTLSDLPHRDATYPIPTASVSEGEDAPSQQIKIST